MGSVLFPPPLTIFFWEQLYYSFQSLNDKNYMTQCFKYFLRYFNIVKVTRVFQNGNIKMKLLSLYNLFVPQATSERLCRKIIPIWEVQQITSAVGILAKVAYLKYMQSCRPKFTTKVIVQWQQLIYQFVCFKTMYV